MMGHGTKFGRKKEEAIGALLSHRNVDEAAQSIKLAPKTLLRWMQIEEFKAAYLKARREAVDQATGRMQQATGAAGVTVLKLMTDPKVPPAARLRAAEFVFELAMKGIQMEVFEVRLAELEAAVERAKPNGTTHLGLAS
jgi:hypothetical protein